MPKKIEIDLEKLKQLHAQGLSDYEIGWRLGASGGTIRMRRTQLGLAPVGRRGCRPGGKGRKPAPATTSSQMASAGRDFKTRRKAIRQLPDAAGAGRVTLSVDETFLDGVWVALDLAKKAQLVNKLCE